MRRLFLLLIAVLPIAEPGMAQSGAINVLCSACRDPAEYPADYANFAVNQIVGPDAWMSFDQADDFYIWNLDGDKVYVDVDFVMTGIELFGATFAFWPEYTLNITLALPDGTMIEILRSIFMTPLPVPSPTGPTPDSDSPSHTGGSGGSSGEDGADDPEGSDDADLEPPDVEPTGTTGIQDPDENGDFPDDDWCEEC